MWAMHETYGMNGTECHFQTKWIYRSFARLSASLTELKLGYEGSKIEVTQEI